MRLNIFYFAQFQGEAFLSLPEITLESEFYVMKSSSGRGSLSDSSEQSGIQESFIRFIPKSSHLVRP